MLTRICGVAVAVVVQASVELRINCMLYPVHKWALLLPVLSHHIGYLVGAGLVLIPPCLGKVTIAFSLTCNGYKIAAKIIA